METFVYRPKGVCSQQMTFTMDGDIIRDVKIVGGCAGNLLGISRILKDKKISEVMEAFHGVRCGMKATSCPDQIATALQAYAKQHNMHREFVFYSRTLGRRYAVLLFHKITTGKPEDENP